MLHERGVFRDGVGLVGRNAVGQVHLLLVLTADLLRSIYLGVEVAAVLHSQLNLAHGYLGQGLVVYLGCLTHLMGIVGKPTIGLRRSIAGGGIVDMELQFPESEYLRVLLLAQVGAHLRGLHLLGIHDLDLSFVEQVLPVRHELGGPACRQQHRQQTTKAEC